jgi:adenylosuccinate lyase
MRNDPVLAAFVDADVAAPERFVGRAPEQVDEFLAEVVRPLLIRHAHRRGRFTPRVAV